MATVEVVPFEAPHAKDVVRLATTVLWPSLTDPAVVTRVCDAPGSVSYVALDGTAGLVGWAQALTDGVLQAHLSFLALHPDHRRRGIYDSLPHRRLEGYRLYPGDPEAT